MSHGYVSETMLCAIFAGCSAFFVQRGGSDDYCMTLFDWRATCMGHDYHRLVATLILT